MFISIIDITEYEAEAAAPGRPATVPPDVATRDGPGSARSAVEDAGLARGATPLRAGGQLLRRHA